MKASMLGMAVADHVQVVIRTRPSRIQELHESVCVSCSANGKSIQVKQQRGRQNRSGNATHARLFTFDACFGGRTDQEELYARCKIGSLVEAAMRGYKATIFAFGQTGAGKTFTTLGPRFSFQTGSSEQLEHLHKDDGVLPRVLHDVWHRHSESSCDGASRVWVSCCEIYQEVARDLLVERQEMRKGLHLRYDRGKDAFSAEGLTRAELESVRDATKILHTALLRRQSKANSVNDKSSRSHCIVTLHFQQKKRQPGGKLSIVDLAGSEKLKSLRQEDPRTVLETKAINKSLFTLGQVLAAVRSSSRGKPREAPYRESKLTQLLWDGLQGTGRTLMIACCTPFQGHYDETMRTLSFASTAIRIKSIPKILLDPKEQLIKNLKTEITRLKNENLTLSQKVQDLTNNQGSHLTSPFKASSEVSESPSSGNDERSTSIGDALEDSDMQILEEDTKNNLIPSTSASYVFEHPRHDLSGPDALQKEVSSQQDCMGRTAEENCSSMSKCRMSNAVVEQLPKGSPYLLNNLVDRRNASRKDSRRHAFSKKSTLALFQQRILKDLDQARSQMKTHRDLLSGNRTRKAQRTPPEWVS